MAALPYGFSPFGRVQGSAQMGERDPSTNAKTTLVEFCQRVTGRSMGKDDIMYEVATFEGMRYQGTCTVNCMGGKACAGELSNDPRLAEQSAGMQALIAVKEELEKKFPGVDLESPDTSMKGKLREAVKKILDRQMTAEDIVYEFIEESGKGVQSSLTLPTLPGSLGGMTWWGQVSPFKTDTMLQAAASAVESILLEPEWCTLDLSGADSKATKKQREKESAAIRKAGKADGSIPKGSGKSKGKGKGKDDEKNPKGQGKAGFAKGQAMVNQMMSGDLSSTDQEWVMETMQNFAMNEGGGGGGWGGGQGYQPVMGVLGIIPGVVMNNAKGKGGSKGVPRPSTQNRQVIGSGNGTVVDWRGRSGFIDPDEPIDHEMAAKHGGKVYAELADTAGKQLSVGDYVCFEVYVDARGIGAQKVTVLAAASG